MSAHLIIKQGDVLRLDLAFNNADGSAMEMAALTVTGQVRTPGGNLLGALTFSAGAASNKLVATGPSTAEWPVGMLCCDLFLAGAGLDVHTETFGIRVDGAITR